MREGGNTMKCQKCEEGMISKIMFKKDQKIAYLCEFCGRVWFENEDIAVSPGHMIQALTKGGEMEYTFVDREKDENSKSVMYPKFK